MRCWLVLCAIAACSARVAVAQPCSNTLTLACPTAEFLDTASVAIFVTDCDRQIDAFGLDVVYRPDHLQFMAIDTRGSLIENWTGVVGGPVPGSNDRVRVGGFDVGGFGPGPERLLVRLRFVIVTPLPYESPIAFVGESLTDDAAGFGLEDCAVTIRPSLSFECPQDQSFPPFATVPTITLTDFRITNPALTEPISFDYRVTAQGPAILNDHGDPSSISGTSPVLAPGETFVPSEAALSVPEIRYPVQQFVVYHVRISGTTAWLDSCVTIIDFEAPVPVLITSFEAFALDAGVDLKWLLHSDEDVRGLKIYRRAERGEWLPLETGHLLNPRTTAHTDMSAAPGQVYEYALAVVMPDGSEVRSQIVQVNTRAVSLVLYPNRPNPFNPSTAIPFSLPERMFVNLSVYNVEGRRVRTLLDQTVPGGYQEAVWDGKDDGGRPVSSGVYFYHLKAGEKVLTNQLVLLK